MPTSQYQLEEYRARINRVIDFVEKNIHRPLPLAELASVAHFSPFHFHRIFGAMTGETLNQFIARVRIEKAASMLVGNPKSSVTKIALDCGFSSSATFARAFRDTFGMSASDWRAGGYATFSKNRKAESNGSKTVSKDRKDTEASSGYIDGTVRDGATLSPTTTTQRRSNMKGPSTVTADVKVETFPELTVAYVRHVGPYKGDAELFKRLWEKLGTWAGPRGLMQQPDLQCFNIYHDSPEITDESKLRTSVCITVPEDTKVDGEIGKMKVKGGKYAVAHFEIYPSQYPDAWNYVFGEWLPKSGYQPDDAPSFERACGDCADDDCGPDVIHKVDICIPVKPL
ncbi:MAG: helix-turn-helix domain-containing protein [Chitinivibrionales bacterium]|nr:helix-turn-helix domain-containing protein [Chitinivibrionales bacterium]MBD3396622.1 helix-turn-helix domain-containing protein [Chitinivibrionales bacterium]